MTAQPPQPPVQQPYEGTKGDYIIIFDCLDTLQGYKGTPITDERRKWGDPGPNKRFYLSQIALDQCMTVEDILRETDPKTRSELHTNLLSRGVLEPRLLHGMLQRIVKVDYRDIRIRPVVMSAGTEMEVRLATLPLVRRGLIDEKDIYATLDLGSKTDPETWRKAKELYEPDCELLAIYEDTPANLLAAIQSGIVPEGRGRLVTNNGARITAIEPHNIETLFAKKYVEEE